ncbi:arginase family protein [Rhizobium sp. Root1220]|uniref:arginase family protein n=1 Tax=Rhizobium sp. Root1220 TaxID=1736432 RepID=UPI001FCD49B2|nr:arginase family protein [Rhizobium sp. Root1220]
MEPLATQTLRAVLLAGNVFIKHPAASAVDAPFCATVKAGSQNLALIRDLATTTLGEALEKTILTAFQGRVGDHNDLAIPGAAALASALSDRLGLSLHVIGTPEPALNTDWRAELDAAMPALQALSRHFESIFEQGARPLTVLTRCAVALATLPIVARHRPDACVVWLDAHADLNAPETSSSGYLGGMAVSGAAGLWESGLGAGLALNNVILLGARDIDPAERKLINAADIQIIRPQAKLVAATTDAIGGRPVYVHLDCDVLNPGIVPSDYQVEGGLTLSDLRAVSEVLAKSEVVGVEIAEFQNAWEIGGPPASPERLLSAIGPLVERFRSART